MQGGHQVPLLQLQGFKPPLIGINARTTPPALSNHYCTHTVRALLPPLLWVVGVSVTATRPLPLFSPCLFPGPAVTALLVAEFSRTVCSRSWLSRGIASGSDPSLEAHLDRLLSTTEAAAATTTTNTTTEIRLRRL